MPETIEIKEIKAFRVNIDLPFLDLKQDIILDENQLRTLRNSFWVAIFEINKKLDYPENAIELQRTKP